MKEPAVAAGVGSVPTSFIETDADWFVWQGLINDFVLGTAVGFDAQGGRQYIVDSKAMRKVGVDEDLVGVIQLSSAVGAEFVARGRTLVKLH